MHNKGKLVATVAIVGVAAAVAFALRGGHISKVVSPPMPAQQQTEGAPPAQVKTAAVPVPAAATRAVSWKDKFESSDDWLRVVKEAIPAAQAGDGRAAYLIAQTLHLCGDVMRRYHDSADPEAQLQQELAELTHVGVKPAGAPPDFPVRKAPLPQWILDQREDTTRRCLGLAKEGAPGGHDPAYWNAKALAAGDPLAQADAARSVVGDIAVDPQTPKDAKAAKLKILQADLRAVVESGDPDALFQAGQFMANPYLTNDTLSAMSVALAACELGANCQQTDSKSGCVQMGTCPAGADWPYFMQKSMGQEAYAQLYARAQQVVELQRAGDTQGVLAYLMKVDEQPTMVQRYQQEHKE